MNARSVLVPLSIVVLLLVSCTRRSSATCRIGEACFECPNADAAMQCVSKLDGVGANCKSAPRDRCN
jgi:hypothetical protein